VGNRKVAIPHFIIMEKKYKKGYGQILITEFWDDDGTWKIAVESEVKGTLFEISGGSAF